MVAKRRARRARSDDPDGGIEGSGIDEESGESSEGAIPAEPKEMTLKRAEEPSAPSPEDAGAQGSGEASPVRTSPTPLGGVAKKTKTTSRKRVKKPPPASQEEDEAEDSGDASPARGAPLPHDSSDSGHDNKSAATSKRGKKRGKKRRLVGPDDETVAVSAPKRKKNEKSKGSAKKDKRKKKKKQLRKALTKPTSPPQLLELELNNNSEDTPSSPEIVKDDEHHDRETAEQEPSKTSLPLEDGRGREKEQQEKEIAEQVDAGGTSPPHDEDMHSAHGEHGDKEELPKDTSPPQGKNKDQEDEETAGAQVVNGKTLQVNNAPSTKLRGSETEKKPAGERSWSYDDELKILNALVEHAQSHDGALPDSSHLLANLTFDKIDANEEKLADKIRKLKTRYRKMLSQGCPSDRLAHPLFKLSEKLWGQVCEDEQVEPTSRDFSAQSKLYPYLTKEVKAYAESHSSRDLIMAMFMTIGDEKARDLDAKCKKLQIEALKLELDQASLINELLSALPSLTRVRF